MKVLVTGAGGFLGGYLVRDLLARGYEVRSLARGAYPELERLGVECHRGDLAESDVVDRAVAGVDAVFHTGAKAGFWGSYDSYFQPNVVGTQNVIDACTKHEVRRLVYTSSPSVVYGTEPIDGGDESLKYPDRYLSPYGQTKAEAERRVMAAHEADRLHTVSLRPHLIFGPGDRHIVPRVIDRAQKGQMLRVGDEQNQVSVSYVENVSEAHLQALDAIADAASVAGGKAYFINEPEPVKLWAFIDRVLDGVGAPKVERRVSYATARRIGVAFELIHKALFLPGEPRMSRFLAAQLATSHWFRVDRARADFGFNPQTSLDAGLEKLFASYRTDRSAALREAPVA